MLKSEFWNNVVSSWICIKTDKAQKIYNTSFTHNEPKPDRTLKHDSKLIESRVLSGTDVIRKNDTVITHLSDEPAEKKRIIRGCKAINKDNWEFSGKKVGERVKLGGVVYIIDEIIHYQV